MLLFETNGLLVIDNEHIRKAQRILGAVPITLSFKISVSIDVQFHRMKRTVNNSCFHNAIVFTPLYHTCFVLFDYQLTSSMQNFTFPHSSTKQETQYREIFWFNPQFYDFIHACSSLIVEFLSAVPSHFLCHNLGFKQCFLILQAYACVAFNFLPVYL